MKKKIIFLTIALTLAAASYSVATAATTQSQAVSAAVGQWMGSAKEAQYNTKLNSPFDKEKTGIRETINQESGDLSLLLPLLTVPSVNGMSLFADLTYSVSDAGDREESADETGNSKNIDLDVSESERTVFGAGFSLDLPYVEVRENVGTFVSLPGGGIYKADFKTGAGLEGYTIKDLIFEKDSTQSIQGRKSAYRLTYPDGTRYYFAGGGRLIMEKDRYDNSIQYIYGTFGDLTVLKGITDEFGRRITFQYNQNEISISNGDKAYTLYLKSTGAGNKKELEKIKDPEGNFTVLSYERIPLTYCMVDGKGVAANIYHAVTEVKYQTGAVTSYTYEESRKGTDQGYLEYLRVATRKDVQNGKEYNVLRYQYWGEADGYPRYRENILPATYTYGRRVYEEDGTAYAYVYDKNHNLINQRTLYNEKEEQETNTVYNPNTKAPILVKNSVYNDAGEALVTTEEYEYDRNGNVVRSDVYEPGHKGEQEIRTTYSLAYNLITGRERKLDKDNIIREVYTLDEKEMNPIVLTIYQNGTKVKSEKYRYDSYGNLTNKGEEIFEGNYKNVWFEYSSEYGGAYLTATVYTDILTTDGRETSIRLENTYDPDTGELLTEKDGDGYVTSYRYDKNGRITEVINKDGTTVKTSYDDSQNTITETNPVGTSIKYFYDTLGNLISVKDLKTGNRLAAFSYDNKERKVRSEDGLGNYQTVTYGKLDRITASSSFERGGKLLGKTSFRYDTAFDLNNRKVLMLEAVQGISPDTITNRQYFDSLGNLIRKDQIGSTDTLTEIYAYDYLGRNTGYTDRDGGIYTKVYDALGNVVKTTNPNGEAQTAEYDLLGNLTKSVSPAGKEVYYTYDWLGRLLKERRNGDEEAQVILSYYDNRGNLIKQVDPIGQEMEYTYDAMGQNILSKTGDKQAGYMESLHEYDKAGNLIRESYGLAGKEKRGVSYTYDHLGRKTAETDELGNSITYTYDAAGNPVSKTDKNGVVTSYLYDGLGRLLSEVNDKDKEQISYTYDGLGRTSRARDNTGEYLFTYDQFSNLIQVRNPLEIHQNYTYDKRGRVTSYIEDRSGIRNQKATYSYDRAGRLTEINTDMANISYGYDRDGKLLSETNSATNEITKYSYDMLSNLTQKSIWQKDKLQSSQKYKYDLLGRKTEEIIGSDYTLYYYDAFGRLTESAEGDSSIEKGFTPEAKLTSYEYDPYSNLTEKSIWQDNGRLKETYTYNGNNQLTSKKVEEKTELFSYDKQGNLINKKEILLGGSYFIDYAYTGKNMLSGVNNNDEIQSSYDYRYDGLRFSKTVDGNTNYFTYNGGNITSELTSQGTHNYYRGSSMIGMTNPQGEKYYFTQNAKGDILGLKDATGATVKTYKYDPFGNRNQDTEKLFFQGVWEQETSQIYNPFGFNGEYTDEETGFIYLRGRYYDPTTERFITEDPTKDGANWYAYCGNDPINHTDPSGYFSIKNTWNSIKSSFSNKTSSSSKTNKNSIKVAPSTRVAVPQTTKKITINTNSKEFKKAQTNLVQLTSKVNFTTGYFEAQENPKAYKEGAMLAYKQMNTALTVSGTGGLVKGGLGLLSKAALKKGIVKGGEEALAVTAKSNLPALYDGNFAARQILKSSTNITPGGRTITAHAAERMVSPPVGRVPTTMREVDNFLDTVTNIRKVSQHRLGDTITLRNTTSSIKEIVVDAETGKRVITVINPH